MKTIIYLQLQEIMIAWTWHKQQQIIIITQVQRASYQRIKGSYIYRNIKNGTSFLVNNTAEIISQKGINTAILDLTQNKNAYYIYTENDENLRNIAYSSIENLKIGNAKGIQVHKNLAVYTSLPGKKQDTSITLIY